MDRLYHELSYQCSRLTTRKYSTSFSIGVRCLDPAIRDAVYAVYGFVRLADEIVDSFHGYDQQRLLDEFEREYYAALQRGLSLNPVINAFRHTVQRYGIGAELVEAFLRSMRRDLSQASYDETQIRDYIFGSAEAVGLMCLRIFVGGDPGRYAELAPYAQRLGAAFQKVNFLRDIGHDTENLSRTYFPSLGCGPLDDRKKEMILADIFEDYRVAEEGIRRLPRCARLGVHTAYLYYRTLAARLARVPAERLLQERVRVGNAQKLCLFGKAYLSHRFGRWTQKPARQVTLF